jgi:hypothetical protein
MTSDTVNDEFKVYILILFFFHKNKEREEVKESRNLFREQIYQNFGENDEDNQRDF